MFLPCEYTYTYKLLFLKKRKRRLKAIHLPFHFNIEHRSWKSILDSKYIWKYIFQIHFLPVSIMVSSSKTKNYFVRLLLCFGIAHFSVIYLHVWLYIINFVEEECLLLCLREKCQQSELRGVKSIMELSPGSWETHFVIMDTSLNILEPYFSFI